MLWSFERCDIIFLVVVVLTCCVHETHRCLRLRLKNVSVALGGLVVLIFTFVRLLVGMASLW